MMENLRAQSRSANLGSTYPAVTVDACKVFTSQCQDRRGRFLNDDSYEYHFGFVVWALIDFDVLGCYKHTNEYADKLEQGIQLSVVKRIRYPETDTDRV